MIFWDDMKFFLQGYLLVNTVYNHLLSERIAQLERNTVNNAQYHCHELLKINPVPILIGNDVLVSNWSSGETMLSPSMSPFEEKGHYDC